MKLAVTEYGTGPALVLLHGWGMHSAVWTPLLELWGEHFRLICVDLPGSGQSPSGSYEPQHLLRQLLAVTPAQATWLGWSLGGLLALLVASQYPARVNRLIMVASNPSFIERVDWPGMKAEVLASFGAELELNSRALIQRFVKTHLMQLGQKSLIRALQASLGSEEQVSQQALVGGLQLLQELDLRYALADLPCDSLHLYGRLDSLVPVAVAQAVASLTPKAQTIVLDKAAHMPFYSQKEVFLQHLKGFINAKCC